MKRSRICLSLLLILTAGTAAAEDTPTARAGTAQAAFDRLKTLEGTWHGTASGGGEGEGQGEATVTHVFRNSAAGTVVMETMNPGSDHEMINMYHLDGDDLVLTHYCASFSGSRLVPPAKSKRISFPDAVARRMVGWLLPAQ